MKNFHLKMVFFLSCLPPSSQNPNSTSLCHQASFFPPFTNLSTSSSCCPSMEICFKALYGSGSIRVLELGCWPRLQYHPLLSWWTKQITLLMWRTQLQHPWGPKGFYPVPPTWTSSEVLRRRGEDCQYWVGGEEWTANLRRKLWLEWRGGKGRKMAESVIW